MFDSLPPLTRFQKRLLVTLTLLIALTRVYSLSLTPWEWDEMLFSTAVREYDVREHHPHPPGFPLFIAAAKAVRFAGASDFHALQFIVFLGATALFPLTVLLARALRFPFVTGIGGGLLLVFAPNVWYYGGTAFSDVPTLALTMGASIAFLRLSRCVPQERTTEPEGADPRRRFFASPLRWYLIAALLLGSAIAFRPQNILVIGVPLLIAAWRCRTEWARMIAALAVAGVIAGASYAAAALASGSLAEYGVAVQKQERYVREVDSFHSATRPPVTSLFKTFFKPTRGAKPLEKLIPAAAAIGAIAAIAAGNAGVLILLLMFGPLNFFSWLMLDFTASSRYTISYAPMYMLFAAHGFYVIAGPLKRKRVAGAATLCAVLAAFFAWRALPALREVRSNPAPPVAAAFWVRSHLDPSRVRIYTTDGVEPFTTYYLPEYKVVVIQTGDPLPADAARYDSWFIVDKLSRSPGSVNFSRARGALWDIARQRYFEASVSRIPLVTSP